MEPPQDHQRPPMILAVQEPGQRQRRHGRRRRHRQLAHARLRRLLAERG
jgi:hypothetical protein